LSLWTSALGRSKNDNTAPFTMESVN
jgi:hypothetical protein